MYLKYNHLNITSNVMSASEKAEIRGTTRGCDGISERKEMRMDDSGASPRHSGVINSIRLSEFRVEIFLNNHRRNDGAAPAELAASADQRNDSGIAAMTKGRRILSHPLTGESPSPPQAACLPPKRLRRYSTTAGMKERATIPISTIDRFFLMNSTLPKR